MSEGKSNKRRQDDGVSSSSKRAPGASSSRGEVSQGLEFEDAFEDEIEEEQVVAEENEMEEEDDMEDELGKRFFQMGIDELGEDEEIEYENSAYVLLHQLKVEWPCLSFDFIRDMHGLNRTKLPATCFMVAGTQADEIGNNKIVVSKMAEMHRTKRDDCDSDSEDDGDDEDLDDDAVVDFRYVKHAGPVNRIRSMPQRPEIVASWSAAGRVYIWDLSIQLRSLGALTTTGPVVPPKGGTAPIFAFKKHKDEGYAMDWSPVQEGRLATGDCASAIYLWEVDGSKVTVDDTPLKEHNDSVEDLQWSPTEATVLASCSVDLSVKIWDIREKKKSMISIDKAHNEDVNVISWNKKVPFLLASGSDDGSFKVWDLRMIKESTQPVGFFHWHKAPITSLEWHPQDETVIAATGADSQVSIWDFGLEEDPEQANVAPKLATQVVGTDGKKVDIPPQLLFLHQGQRDLKELHFHPQIPGLIGSTALDGFHAFICEPLDPKQSGTKYLA